MTFKYFTRADLVLIAGLLILAVGGFSGIRQHGFNGKHVVVEVDGRRVLELSLDQDVSKTVNGPSGETLIIVENGTVRVSASDCPHHYCVRMGRIKRPGEIIVCVPNSVVVSIKGGRESEKLDGVTQ